MVQLGTIFSRTTEAPKKTQKLSFEQALEAKIKKTLAGDEAKGIKAVNVSDIKEFKDFLNGINDWITKSDDYSLEERQTTVNGANINLSKLYFQARKELEDGANYQADIEKAQATIVENLEVMTGNISFADNITATDKAIFTGLNQNTTNLVAKNIGNFANSIATSQIGFSIPEQKVLFYKILEKASLEARNEPDKSSKPEVFFAKLNQGLEENSDKFSRFFLSSIADELNENSNIVGTVSIQKKILHRNKALIEKLSGGSEKALSEISAREKNWQEASKNLSESEIAEVVKSVDETLLSIKSLDPEADKESLKAVLEKAKTFKGDNAEEMQKAFEAYMDLSTVKTLESQALSNQAEKAMPELLEKALGALAILVVGKFVLGFAGASNPALAAKGIQSSGGLMQKAMGLLAIGGVLNGMNFNLDVGDEISTNDSQTKQKPPEHKKSQTKV